MSNNVRKVTSENYPTEAGFTISKTAAVIKFLSRRLFCIKFEVFVTGAGKQRKMVGAMAAYISFSQIVHFMVRPLTQDVHQLLSMRHFSNALVTSP